MKTLGVMMPGEYKFDTKKKEVMDISSGKVDILLSEEQEWIKIEGGMSFEVPANSSFSIKVYSITNYCCSYI